MIKERYEKKTYLKTEEVMVSQKRYCDVCGAEIKGPHWSITTGHNDWGNDSCDSVEYYDACSRSCFNKLIDDYINKTDDRLTSQYFEIEHRLSAMAQGDVRYDEM